jgi:hypothetical protein
MFYRMVAGRTFHLTESRRVGSGITVQYFNANILTGEVDAVAVVVLKGNLRECPA